MSDFESADQVKQQEQALETAENVFGASSIEAAAVLVKLGGAHRSAGHLAEAHRAWVRALEISEEILGTDHVQLARIFCCLAELELARGRFVTGESYARRSLEICGQAAGVTEAEVADSSNVLAALLAGQCCSAESEHLPRSASPE